MKARIIKEQCPADNRICKPMQECPAGAILYIKDDDEPLGGRMEVDQQACTGCGDCVPLCCGNCIVLE